MEGNSIVANDTLDGIAQAINAKLGTSGKMTVQQMAGKIDEMVSSRNYLDFGYYSDKLYVKGPTFSTSLSNLYELSGIYMPGVISFQAQFYECSSFYDVYLPNATEIGNYAFQSCPLGGSLDFSSVTSVGDSAFAFNSYSSSYDSLYSINLPEAVTIGSSAFSGRQYLSEVLLPKATQINGYAFGECYTLTSLDLSSMTQAQVLENASYWGIPSGCAVICSDGTITIE